MNHPEKMPDSRYTLRPISQAEIAAQHMELGDRDRAQTQIGREAVEASAGEMRVVREVLGIKDSPEDEQE